MDAILFGERIAPANVVAGSLGLSSAGQGLENDASRSYNIIGRRPMDIYSQKNNVLSTRAVSACHCISEGAQINPTTPPSGNRLDISSSTDKIDDAAQMVHQTTERIADKAVTGIDRLSGTTHRAINSAADATLSAADWTSSVADQATEIQTRVTQAASASIRERPLIIVAGALILGYIIGRIGN